MKSWFWSGAVLAVAFVLTRLPALTLQAHDSDINLYARYAAEWHAAGRRGESFYEHHRQRIDAEIAQATPGQARALREYAAVEYPPLAVAVMAVPALLVEDPFDGEYPTGFAPRYACAYIGVMALFDLVVVCLVIGLVHRLYPAESPRQKCGRCLFYVLATWPLYAVLYARLDLGVAVAVVAALALLVSRRGWAWSFLVLALGVHFKLMPVVLAPLWIVAALPASALRGPWREMVRPLAARSAVLAAFGLGILGIFYVLQGPAILDFLGYHKERGLEIESTWSSLLLALQPLGLDWHVYHSHGSVNVSSSLSPALAVLATATMALLLLAASVAFVVVARRQGNVGRISNPSFDEKDGLEIRPTDRTVARAHPRLVAGFALLLMLISIAANKVFSPQYLLWVLPLIALVDLPPSARRLFFGATLAACYLTMCIFPDYFVGQIVYVVGHEDGVALFAGPTPFGAFLLLTRNAIVLGLTAGLALVLLRPTPAYLPSPTPRPTIAPAV